MTTKTQIQCADSFHLADRVRIKDLCGQIGRITELRGPLGPGGSPVYRVKVSRKRRISYVELLSYQLESLPPTKALCGQGIHFRSFRAVPSILRSSKTINRR